MIQLFKIVHAKFLTDEVVFSSKGASSGCEYIPKVPIENFFYSQEVDDETRHAYLKFIERTRKLAKSGVRIADLPQEEVQRSVDTRNLLM